MNDMREARIKQLQDIKTAVLRGGGEDKIEKQHQKGRMVARERIDYLLDKGSFVEFGMLLGHQKKATAEGIVSGHGTIDGRRVCIYSQDVTVQGGSVGGITGYKMYQTIELAFEMGVPLIGLHDSAGARLAKLNEGDNSTAAGEKNAGSVFMPNTKASGVVPQIAGMFGSCAGMSVYSPAMNDFIFMVDKQSHMFITGPVMVNSVLGEENTVEELGGAAVHCQISGVADGRYPDEKACLDSIRDLLSYLPLNHNEHPPAIESQDSPDRMNDDLLKIIPESPNRSYDMHRVINSVVDDGRFFEIKREFAGEMIVGFGRLNGKVTGIIANNPIIRAGSLTTDASDKQARFIRFCDCFNIPIVLLVDTPAYMPGRAQEHAGIIRHGAKVLYALCEATVPRISVLMRKCYGGATLGMGIIPGLGTDFVYTWPTAEMGVLGAEASVALYFGNEIAAAPDPAAFRKQKVQEFTDKNANPIQNASSNWSVADVIDPRETRKVLIRSFAFLESKNRAVRTPKRHGNIPL